MLGARTLVMGIINVTPDSFADGGLRFDAARAVADGVEMVAAGADILDVGGESTRPGAEPVTEAEELRRVLPVVEGLTARVAVPISVDTYKSGVARRALDAGARLINDISGLSYDPALVEVAASTGAGLVLMHTRGRSSEMYRAAQYASLMDEVAAELEASVAAAVEGGVSRDRILVDPGIGFAKLAEHSLAAIAQTDRLLALDRPLVVGPSRKSFLRGPVGDVPPIARDWGTAAAVTAAVLLGAHVVRVHAVAEMVQVARVADALLRHRHSFIRSDDPHAAG